MLGEEYAAFLGSYTQERTQGLRLNTLKGTCDELESVLFEEMARAKEGDGKLAVVPWARGGYYYSAGDNLENHEAFRPGKHPLHAAGMYYIQEPSAMAVVGLTDRFLPQNFSGVRALDLCAAPGGKSTQLAALMRGQGLLVSNEIHPGRAKILSENIERMGVSNAVVMNESPEKLAGRFPSFFDVIIVDAPCSGEGMFRKEEAAIREWSEDNVRMCAERQLSILEEAIRMLADGGLLIYSTCTFSSEENEENVALTLAKHPELKAVDLLGEKDTCPNKDASIREQMYAVGLRPGNPDWCDERTMDMPEEIRMQVTRAVRLFPHLVSGEGHFLAAFRKDGERIGSNSSPECLTVLLSEAEIMNTVSQRGQAQEKHLERRGREEKRHKRESITNPVNTKSATISRLVRFGDEVSLLPEGIREADLRGLKVLRPGLHLGTIRKDRFEPSHALALAGFGPSVLPGAAEYELTLEEAVRYLKGETLMSRNSEEKPPTGWTVVTYRKMPLGWMKAAGGVLKNHYPKGLRWLG